MSNEACCHCGHDRLLIVSEWGVFYCQDRAGCLDRMTLQRDASRQALSAAHTRIRDLTELLERAERRAEGLEKVADAALGSIVDVSRSYELNALADHLEASWHGNVNRSRST